MESTVRHCLKYHDIMDRASAITAMQLLAKPHAEAKEMAEYCSKHSDLQEYRAMFAKTYRQIDFVMQLMRRAR